MDHTKYRVLIADDEQIVREGLKYIIDWEKDGFFICGEAENGEDALKKMKLLSPDLVLLDIRMPRLSGTELIEAARKNGYTGEFIILSGYSDFSYAQTAIRYGVAFYLTKPIDEDELEKALLELRERIAARKNTADSLKQYLSKAKPSVIFDLLHGKEISPSLNYEEMGLLCPVYQVIVYEWFSPYYQSYNFADLLRISNQKQSSFEQLSVDGYDVILLKGTNALERLQTVLKHYEEGTQKGSPLDSVFLACGPVVSRPEQIHESYDACCRLMERRFFCDENQHVLFSDMLPAYQSGSSELRPEAAQSYSSQLVDLIQSYNRRQITEVLTSLRTELYNSGVEVSKIKYFLADVFLQVKQSITNRYTGIEIPFAHNAAIIELIENKSYLYEILRYFSEQFDMMMRAIGSNSSDSIFDDILYYIAHNYSQPLRLESIAPLFGYNSSYLGKLFTQKTGQNFNAWLDALRIREAEHLLSSTSMKVYEIATQVGYRNVDYFHQKFRKQNGMSPAEYRKNRKPE